jgi:pimeloyl-ACP methyl ester carboxylesterase
MAHTRREFLGIAAMTAAAAPFAAATVRASTGRSFGTPRQIDAGLLNVGYIDAGPPKGPVVVLLHGWPFDIHSFVDVAPLLVTAGYRVIIPYLRGYGTTRFQSSDTFRNGQQSALAQDVIALMDALAIEKAIVAGFDWGARTANVMAVLWPERCNAIVSVSGYLIVNLAANQQPLTPQAELGWWYQYYFATERGVRGYTQHRHDFNKLIWRITSPKWSFDDATFDQTARAFDNPDHVDIVVHNYRWRLQLADGERRYDAFEQKLAEAPAITVPAITIGSDFDGAAADGKRYAAKYTERHSHRIFDGIGHNVPQEAPRAFADAVIDADRLLPFISAGYHHA